MEEKIGLAFQDAFGVPPAEFHLDVTPDDVTAWDSLGHMRLVTALQERFGVEFEIDEVMEMDSVRKIVEVLQNKGAA
jgi:acyl carrier protein